jgi:hypothetical protein
LIWINRPASADFILTWHLTSAFDLAIATSLLPRIPSGRHCHRRPAGNQRQLGNCSATMTGFAIVATVAPLETQARVDLNQAPVRRPTANNRPHARQVRRMTNSDVASVTHRLLPILDWIPGYRRDWRLPDVLAGLALWAVMVPEGMAYAGIVGVPPIMGLYTIVPATTGL